MLHYIINVIFNNYIYYQYYINIVLFILYFTILHYIINIILTLYYLYYILLYYIINITSLKMTNNIWQYLNLNDVSDVDQWKVTMRLTSRFKILEASGEFSFHQRWLDNEIITSRRASFATRNSLVEFSRFIKRIMKSFFHPFSLFLKMEFIAKGFAALSAFQISWPTNEFDVLCEFPTRNSNFASS